MPLTKHANVKNALIAGLPRDDRIAFLKHCEPVTLVFGDILCEADQPMTHAYFPMKGFISRTSILDEHQPLEIGLIGNEGMLGATLALGVNEAPMRAVVQGAGTALRMTASALRRELRGRTGIPSIIHRYLYLLIAQLARSSACTRFHEIEPRLARWLLMTHDRAHADHFRLTHEFLADMLGVRRSGVSIAAAKLQRKRLIRYSRGEINVLDRKGLEAASCTCYAALDIHAKAFHSIR
jgi:CRP-like cAMP-binding protein